MEIFMRFLAKAAVLVLLTTATFTPTTARAQSLSDDVRVANAINLLELWLDAQRSYDEIPSIAAAVVHDQELVWSGAFGYANLESQTLATPGTMYSICSISKLFTSVSAMRLRDRGLFRLDDQVSALLPWFEIKNRYPDGAAVTVEGVMTHSAGLPRELALPYWTAPFDAPTHDEIVAKITEQETLYPAWKYFQYSNLGLTLVGEIVAELSDQPYAEYVRENILTPLGMTSTTPEIGDVQGTDKLATGYSAVRRDGRRVEVEPFEGGGMAPAMGFASTVEDLAKFASWQFRLLETGEREILDANTLREMQRVHYMDPGWETTWGLGFSLRRRDGVTFVGHGGSCPGHQTSLQMENGDKIATIAMTNAMVSAGSFTQRAHEVMAPAIKEALENPDEGEATPAEFKQYVGAYDSYPWGGESQVIPWKGGLATVGFPTQNPLGGISRLKHVEGHTFQRILDDGELGREVTFELDEDGGVVRMWTPENSSERVR